MTVKQAPGVVKKIGSSNVAAILMLGTTGQIAWAVENTWFNTFVYDKVTTDPNPIAWMVAISAITATLTTIMIGTWSDRKHGRWGKRKPFIVVGYIIWGLITAVYPMISYIHVVHVAVFMVIFLDAVMTFFGSTANDAAFNAWLTDIGHSSNRNRIQTLNSATAFIANIIAFVLAGSIIDNYGYFMFFYILGGIVMLSGFISIFMVKSSPIKKEESKVEKTYISELAELINPRIFKNNRVIFLLFLTMAITGIATQVYFPYLLIFIEHYLGFSKTEMGVYLGIFVVLSVIFLILFGLISHKFNRKDVVLFGTIINSIMMVLVGFLVPFFVGNKTLSVMMLTIYFLGTFPSLAAIVVHGAWLQDRYPENKVGRFQGIRMIFMVMLPMVIGPPIGSLIIHSFGIPVPDGYIPTPEIFIVGGVISFFGIIPLLAIPREEGLIKFET
ncbi:MAG: MFS transporter [Promethearchaeota archaeon]